MTTYDTRHRSTAPSYAITWLMLLVGMSAFLMFGLVGCSGKPTSDAAEEQVSPEAMTAEQSKGLAVDALKARLDDMQGSLYVYRDYRDTQNHFTQRAMEPGSDQYAVMELDEDWRANPHSGASCIRCEHKTAGGAQGGWTFLNGYLPEGSGAGIPSDGSKQSVGLDLTGATELRFFARGSAGGEVVDFFCAGFGHDDTERMANPDSAPRCVLEGATLSTDWQEYSIPLDGIDLTSVSCGFGFHIDGELYERALRKAQEKRAKEAEENNEEIDLFMEETNDALFFVDDIRFVGDLSMLQGAPLLMRAYDTDDKLTRSVALTYDNATAAMAFLSQGMNSEAEVLLDAFVYAVEHDRSDDSRIRNAYAAGSLSPDPGWGSDVRLAGWDPNALGKQSEDPHLVGTDVESAAAASLALLQYANADGADAQRVDTYQRVAQTLMDWVLANCSEQDFGMRTTGEEEGQDEAAWQQDGLSDGAAGFTAGIDGWPESGEWDATKLNYKTMRHNAMAYAAAVRLLELTGEQRYEKAAQSALACMKALYDEDKELFWARTEDDGVTAQTDNVTLEAQVLPALALGEEFGPFEGSLRHLGGMETSDGGYRYHTSNEKGFWCEGTALAACLYGQRGDSEKANEALEALHGVQLEGGLLPESTLEELETGERAADGTMRTIGSDARVAPTAWYVMACNGYNPLSFS